ncbi:MAG: uroporphyrinogen decarboxylase [Planctomycetes bacterium]|nr:uroporphyrinogen decarboxylase [Planctomycetota bacterium]
MMLPTFSSRQRLLRSFTGEPIDRPAVWLMRQAGRYLSGYRAVRAQHGFWDVCKTPALSTQVALEPMALFPFDAAIVFSDILVVPDALGLNVSFSSGGGDGPRIGRPLRSRVDLDAWQLDGVQARLAFVPRAAAHLRAALPADRGLLGFAGAPFTLLCYSVDGGSSDDFVHTRTLLARDPGLAEAALSALATVAADLLCAQLDAGCDVVQLFDTWGGLLTRDDYARFALPALRAVTDRVRAHTKGQGKTILFVRGGHHLLPLLGEAGVDGLSLDWRTPWREARTLHPRLTLQGNIDPVALFAGADHVRARVRALLRDMRADDDGRRCIINLGHGILPGTPEDAVAALVDEVLRGAG